MTLWCVLHDDQQPIGYFEAVRVEGDTGAADTNAYEAKVSMVNAATWTGRVEHRPSDGAWELLRRSLKIAETEWNWAHAEEEWRPIFGYEGVYEVSDHGRVRSLPRDGLAGSILQGHQDKRGYRRVQLCQRGGRRMQFVHRLVASAFLGEGLPGQQVCHYDGKPGNNRVDNLRWASRGDNARDSVRHGTHPMTRRKVCPRGHELIEPNLRSAALREGKRKCLACHRAGSKVRKFGGDIKEIADWHYTRIMRDESAATGGSSHAP